MKNEPIIFPEHFRYVYTALRLYDFVYDSIIDIEMKKAYDDVLANRETYIEIFRQCGFELVFEKGCVHIDGSLNNVQFQATARKVVLYTKLLNDCSLQNSRIVNNEPKPGMTFTRQEFIDSAKSNRDIIEYLEANHSSLKKEFNIIGELEGKLNDMASLGLVETADRERYQITPVFDYYKSFVKEFYEASRNIKEEQ